MICYKDMTFCSFYTTCKFGDKCFRALTEEVRKAAGKAEIPIGTFIHPPGCWQANYIDEENG